MPSVLACQQKVPTPSKTKPVVMVALTGLQAPAPDVGVMVAVGVMVRVGVEVIGNPGVNVLVGVDVRVGVMVRVGVKVGPVGVQVGAWVGTPKLPDKLLLDSLLSVITLVESTVAVLLPAEKVSVTD